MAKQDYYATLGVTREAGSEDLKKAYRKLAMQYHPDRNPGDKQAEARFKEVSEAYDILKDDQKRAAYDRYGHAGLSGNGRGFGSVTEAQYFAAIGVVGVLHVMLAVGLLYLLARHFDRLVGRARSDPADQLWANEYRRGRQ